MKHQQVSRTALIATLTVVAVVLALGLLYQLRTPLGWMVLAAFIAVTVSGPVNWLAQKLPRGGAITLTYFGLLFVPIGMLMIVVPPFVEEAARFVQQVPRYATDIEDYVNKSQRLKQLDAQYGIVERLQEQAAQLPERLGDAASWLGSLGVGLVNSAFALITILLLSIFMVAGGRRWIDAGLELGSQARAVRLRRMLDSMADAVGAYVGGAILQATIAGLTTWVVLLILGVPFAAPLSVLVALFDLIPMVGATIAAVFVAVVTLFSDFPTDTVIWVVWSLAYQQIENNVIQPRIQSKVVGVHPFVVIVSVLLFGTLFGVIGAILAVPFAASMQIMLREWWSMRQDQMLAAAVEGDDPPAPLGPA
ncbi:MAG: AI-2E family transporter [Patulibacter sp.]